ncbi:MAG: AraC family transcriptional regulator ligand-binding domain-containing protein [Polyangiales bacterium]
MSKSRNDSPRNVATVTANVAYALFEFARTKGHDPVALARRFDLELDELAAVDARITAPIAQRLWAELPVILDDDNLGLHLGLHLAPLGALLPVLVMTSAETIGDGIFRGLELQRLLGEGSEWIREDTDDGLIRLHYTFADPVAAAPRHALEFGFALLILAARRVTHDDVAPAAMYFRHAAPKNPREQEELFRCPIHYSQPRDEVHMFARLLSLPVRTSNPMLLSHLEAHGRKLLSERAPSDTFAGRVQKVLREDLAHAPTVESVAAAMGCAPRTLQRRLQEDGTSLHALYEQVRYARACELLRDKSLGIRAVAIELGFSEQAAFHRAFVRWSGVSPGQWRTANAK